MSALRNHAPNHGIGSEDRLVRDFLLGEPSAVAHVQRLITRVVRFRGYFVPDADCPDLIQEVLLILCQTLAKPGFTFTEGLAPFIRSVAHRRCVDWMRRHRELAEIGPDLPASEPSPDETLLLEERHDLAMSILEKLPESCRALIRLHGEGAMTYRQIAERVGGSEASLRTRMYECLKEAREILRRELTSRRTRVPQHWGSQ